MFHEAIVELCVVVCLRNFAGEFGPPSSQTTPVMRDTKTLGIVRYECVLLEGQQTSGRLPSIKSFDRLSFRGDRLAAEFAALGSNGDVAEAFRTRPRRRWGIFMRIDLRHQCIHR